MLEHSVHMLGIVIIIYAPIPFAYLATENLVLFICSKGASIWVNQNLVFTDNNHFMWNILPHLVSAAKTITLSYVVWTTEFIDLSFQPLVEFWVGMDAILILPYVAAIRKQGDNGHNSQWQPISLDLITAAENAPAFAPWILYDLRFSNK